VKGADQCPRCASRRTKDGIVENSGRFYARTIRGCVNCSTIWEPFDPAQMLDTDMTTSSFVEPCDNCAFRPGSPEQADTEKWKETVASLKAGGRFYCHKGVPIDIKNENGFAYPKDGKDPTKLRLCRGYLNMWGAMMDKARKESPDT
jgi:hypothetical protein